MRECAVAACHTLHRSGASVGSALRGQLAPSASGELAAALGN